MRNINKNNITTEILYAFGLSNTQQKGSDANLKFFAEASAREVIALGDLGCLNNVNLVLHQSYKQYANGKKQNYVDNIWENSCGDCNGLYVCFDVPCMKMPCIDLCPIDCPEECEINDCEEGSCSPCDRLVSGTSTNVRLGQVYQEELSTHNSVETDCLNLRNRCHYDGAQIRMKNGNYTAKVGYGKEGKSQGMNHLSSKDRNMLDLELKINLGKFGKAKIGHLNHDEKDSSKDKSATYATYDICFNKFKLRSAWIDPKKAGEKTSFSVSVGSEVNGINTEFTYFNKNQKDTNWAITATKDLDSDTVGFIHYDSDKKEIDLGAKGGFLLSLEGGDACEPCIE